MKNKIILFDIDGTLFDSNSFLNDFCREASNQFSLRQTDSEEIKNIYAESKKDDYFRPSDFLKKLSIKFTLIDPDLVKKIFWNVDLFVKNVYKDTSVIENLANFAVIGIFSKGDVKFQKQKIFSFKQFLDDDNIYIFPNKIGKTGEVFGKYNDFEIYFVDNEEDVLLSVKSLFTGVSAILIDRENRYQNKSGLIKIKDLNELKSIITYE